jgi:hypothetical protein
VRTVRLTVEQSGGILRRRSGCHSKVLVSDHRMIISSYNFLSADPFHTASRAREVGVLLESEFLAKNVVKVLMGISSTSTSTSQELKT